MCKKKQAETDMTEKKMHTRETDERLLMQFALDQGWDMPDLMEAVERLSKCHEDRLQDYSIPDCEVYSND